MVSFAAHTNLFSNENNPNSSSLEPLNDLDGEKRDPKTFEKSPHPNKYLLPQAHHGHEHGHEHGNKEEQQPHVGQEQVNDVSMMTMPNSNMHDIDGDMDLMLQPCVTNVDSPQASGKEEPLPQDNSFLMEQQEQQQPKQDDDSATDFDEWVASTGTTDPHIQTYLVTKARRIQATEQFQLSLEECLDGFQLAMTQELLAETVGTIFNDNSSLMDDIEETIQATLHSNHRQRDQMWKHLEQANSNWERQFKRMRATLAPSTINGQIGNGEHSPGMSSDQVEEDGNTPNVKSEENGQDAAISWEELTSDEMTGPVARSFLDARKKRRDAEDVLSNALDEIHAGLQADVNDISQAIVTMFDHLQQATSALEKDIEHSTMRNAKRRQDLELRLQESSKQTLGLLSGLMSRLAGSSSSS